MFTFFLMIAFWWKWPCGGERRIRFGLNPGKTNWEIFDLSAEIPWRRPDRNNIGCFRTQTHTHKDSPKQTDTDQKKTVEPYMHLGIAQIAVWSPHPPHSTGNSGALFPGLIWENSYVVLISGRFQHLVNLGYKRKPLFPVLSRGASPNLICPVSKLWPLFYILMARTPEFRSYNVPARLFVSRFINAGLIFFYKMIKYPNYFWRQIHKTLTGGRSIDPLTPG